MLLQNKAVLTSSKEFHFPNSHLYFPAYGKLLMGMRRLGKIPVQRVMVVFDWNTAITYPQIVLPNNIPLEALRFDYLAGLPVQIVYREKDAHRVDSVVQEILKVYPSFLATFALDLINDGMAWTLIIPFKRIKAAA